MVTANFPPKMRLTGINTRNWVEKRPCLSLHERFAIVFHTTGTNHAQNCNWPVRTKSPPFRKRRTCVCVLSVAGPVCDCFCFGRSASRGGQATQHGLADAMEGKRGDLESSAALFYPVVSPRLEERKLYSYRYNYSVPGRV